MTWSLSQLRTQALSHSLFPPTTLSAAFEKMGFVQADPIRSPARAQDLILRHRVVGYKNGDLEMYYPTLELEEDILYAYGFLHRSLWQYLYPRKDRSLSELEVKILAVAERNETPLEVKELERLFGRERVINAWGGHSQATKNALENLHYAGHLRIVGRDKGRRIYIKASPFAAVGDERGRLKRLIRVVVIILAPVSERTLNEALWSLRRSIGETKTVVNDMVKTGELERRVVDGLPYILPAGMQSESAPHEGVKFLAPFDPVVWDRRRFEHLWGWAYRFEAYTPAHKRVRGYYSLPLLWQEQIVGWANVSVKDDELHVETGFRAKPSDPVFVKELNAEQERMRAFLLRGSATS